MRVAGEIVVKHDDSSSVIFFFGFGKVPHETVDWDTYRSTVSIYT
jgi:hypothetical protein